MIEKCALAVITNRGRDVVPPTLSALDDDEEDFLDRHVERLRAKAGTEETRGRFRSTSTLEKVFGEALSANDAEFVQIATRLTGQLAEAMLSVNSASCVLAFVVSSAAPAAQRFVSLLKLDANIEAARLINSGAGVRLRVFRDLLPSPGDIQKGLSWPDPRSPHSDIIVLDAVVQGTAQYFQNAFDIDASPTSLRTETALVEELVALPPSEMKVALSAIGKGGDAEVVVRRIREHVPDWQATAPELGSGGAMPGVVRSTFVRRAKKTYTADGIELSVPLEKIGQVTTRQVGTLFETTIVTPEPLTPPIAD